MSYFGDYDTSAVIYGMFTTYRPSTGAAYTLAGTPVVRVYKNGSTTQHTTTYSVTTDFDTLAGLNYFTIDTSADGTFFSAGGDFTCVLEAGTVDSVSVVGTVVGKFGLRKDSSLKPTTAGRTLDVSAGGEAGIDWANVGSPTTPVNLSATNIDVDQVVASVSGAVGSVTGNVGGNVTGSVGSIAANGIAAASIATGALTATKFSAGAIDAAALATDAVDEIRDGVWGKTQAELTGDPGATPTVLQSLALPYMAIRNKRDTDSGLGTDEIHNSAGTVILTATISDAAGVFSKAKYV